MEIIHGEIGERVHTYLERITPFGFAGAVLVAQHGEVLLNHGYGYANRSKRIPNSAETVFNLGSLTKQFTAAGILRLEQQGKLSVEDALERFFPAVPADKQTVTIHHMLTHTAGMPSDTGEDYEEAGREETVDKILTAPLLFEPGSAYRYSNAGYSLLAAIIERVSQQDYESFLSEQIFIPAGMRATGYRLPGWEYNRLARGYIAGQDRGNPLEKIYPSWNVMGNGEMLSTTTDLYHWYQALKSEQVLSIQAKKKLWTPFLQDYAYGWLVHDSDFGPVVEHNGAGDTGMCADLKWYTAEDVLIALFGNQTLADGRLPILVVDQKISELVFNRPVSLPPSLPDEPDPAHLEQYAGTYQLVAGAQFKVLLQPDGLTLHPNNQEAINLLWDLAPADRQACLDFNRRVEIAFGSLIEGDPTALLAELGDQKRAERFQAYMKGILLSMSEDQEATSKPAWNLSGTVPAVKGQRAVTRMVLENGSAAGILEVYWEKERVYGLRAIESRYPPGIALRSLTEARFVGYDLATCNTVEIDFEPGRKHFSLVSY